MVASSTEPGMAFDNTGNCIQVEVDLNSLYIFDRVIRTVIFSLDTTLIWIVNDFPGIGLNSK